MAVVKLEVNEIVCIETVIGGKSIIHFKGGRYIEATGDDTLKLAKLLNPRLQKVMSVYGDPAEPVLPAIPTTH